MIKIQKITLKNETSRRKIKMKNNKMKKKNKNKNDISLYQDSNKFT